MSKRLTMMLVVAIVLVAFVAPVAAKEKASSHPYFAVYEDSAFSIFVSQTISWKGGRYDAENTAKQLLTDYLAACEKYGKPNEVESLKRQLDEGWTYLFVPIQVKNHSGECLTFSNGYLSIVTVDGSTYSSIRCELVHPKLPWLFRSYFSLQPYDEKAPGRIAIFAIGPGEKVNWDQIARITVRVNKRSCQLALTNPPKQPEKVAQAK